MGYRKDVLRGVSWITLLRASTRIGTFVRLAILGRLLTPTQFGFFGIASLLLSLLEIFTETGINVFLIQHKGEIKDYINSAWIVSILRGILLALLILIFAPAIAIFFNAKESQNIISLIALVPIIRGFINPAIISYQKDLLFAKEFNLRNGLFFIDITISIIVGFITRSGASFIWGLIASAAFEVLFSYLLIPVWPKIKFEYVKIRYVISRGVWITLTGIFSYFADNGDNIAVGRILGSSSLGVYQIAYKFSTLPISEITNVINQVIFPVLSKFSNDRERLWRAFVKLTIVSVLGSVITGGVIFFFAKPIMLIIMGPQWVVAVPAIQILALYGILRTAFGNFAPLFLSVGKQRYVAQMTAFRTITLLVVIVPLVIRYGMVGAGLGMFISILIEVPAAFYFAYRVFRR